MERACCSFIFSHSGLYYYTRKLVFFSLATETFHFHYDSFEAVHVAKNLNAYFYKDLDLRKHKYIHE